MNHTNINASGQPETRGTVSLRTAVISIAVLVMLGTSVHADMYQPNGTTPGGVPAQSTITSINTAGTNSTVSWYGMQGWYTVLMSTNSGVSYTRPVAALPPLITPGPPRSIMAAIHSRCFN